MTRLEAIAPKGKVTVLIDGEIRRVGIVEAHKLVTSGHAEYRPKSVFKNQDPPKKDLPSDDTSGSEKPKLKAKEIRKINKKNK